MDVAIAQFRRYSASMAKAVDESGALINDRYHLQARIARGGVGVVYRAEDLAVNRAVAFKISREANTTSCADFANERARLSAIDHPGVPKVYEAGRLEDGRSYLVTEWIVGQSLEALVLQSSITLPNALTVGVAIADVLIALHTSRVLHRDIKPLNVLIPFVESSPHFEGAKVIDFGIAADMTERTIRGEPSTPFGKRGGTPIYMAPEQIAGHRQTAAADVFGLGATLFFMLYHRPPMGDGPVPRAALSFASMPHIMCGPFIERRLTEEIALPNEPFYPAALRDLVTALTRRSPGERLPTALEVRRHLRDLQGSLLRDPDNSTGSPHL